MTSKAFEALLDLINLMVEAKVNDPDGSGHYRREVKTPPTKHVDCL
jgi:hypothetical protein